jgi:hypothetical protein
MNLKSPFTTQVERGGYSAIVYEDGDLIVAENDVGTVIAEGTNAATIINAGVDSLPANGGLILLKDRFVITETITLDTVGIIFQGDSWHNSGLETTSDIPMITVTDGAPKLIIEKLWLEGANDVAKTNNQGILFSGTTAKYDMQLQDIFIHQAYDGVKGHKIAYIGMDNVRISKTKHDAIHITGEATAYSGFHATNVFLKEYGNCGMYLTYNMGNELINMWLEGDNVGTYGLYCDHGYMNFLSNIDSENHSQAGYYFGNDVFGSTLNGLWSGGNDNNSFVAVDSKQLMVSQCYALDDQNMGFYIKDADRMTFNQCYAMINSQSGAGAHSGFTFENVTNSIITGSHAYDYQGTKTQKYGIEELGTSDYNRFVNNNLRGNLILGIYTIGAHNAYDLHKKSSIFDLSGGASDIESFHAIAPCTLVGYQILYTEASSADAGVNIRIGRYQSGVALDDDYFDISTSEVSKNKGYAKFFKTADLTQKTIAVGDTITVGTAGGKTGTGGVCLILLIAEQSD